MPWAGLVQALGLNPSTNGAAQESPGHPTGYTQPFNFHSTKGADQVSPGHRPGYETKSYFHSTKGADQVSPGHRPGYTGNRT